MVNQFDLAWDFYELSLFYDGVCFKGQKVEVVIKAFKSPYKIFKNDSALLEFCNSGNECPDEIDSKELCIIYTYTGMTIFLFVDENGIIQDYDLRIS